MDAKTTLTDVHRRLSEANKALKQGKMTESEARAVIDHEQPLLYSVMDAMVYKVAVEHHTIKVTEPVDTSLEKADNAVIEECHQLIISMLGYIAQ